MLIGYIDECGDSLELPSDPSLIRDDHQPVFIISALVFPQQNIYNLTRAFNKLKLDIFPEAAQYAGTHPLNAIKYEIKGSTTRNSILDPKISIKRKKNAYEFIDRILSLIVKHEGIISSKIFIKGIGEKFHEDSVYTSAIQYLYRSMQDLCLNSSCMGTCIADNRNPKKNDLVSHATFTQKYRSSGDAYPNLIDSLSFRNSRNCAGLQLCDLLTSALIYPMACQAYCADTIHNLHTRPTGLPLWQRYGKALEALQHFVSVENGEKRGSIVVSDSLAQRPSTHLFRPPPMLPTKQI